jgi:hypothetical protein
MNRAIFVTLLLSACDSPMMMMPAGSPPVYVQPNPLDVSTKRPANFSCLGKRVDPAAPTAPTTIQVVVQDFEKETPVEGATVEVYLSLAKVNARTPDAASAPTNKMGQAMLTVPPGSYRVIFRTFGAPKTIETLEFNRKFDDTRRYSVSETTKETIQAVLSIFPDETLGVVAGALRDCDGIDTGAVVLETTSTGGSFDNKSNTFYFDETTTGPVPVRGFKWAGSNGVFASVNVPPGDVTLTVRGVLSEGGETSVLSRGTAPLRANSITVVQMEPLGP